MIGLLQVQSEAVSARLQERLRALSLFTEITYSFLELSEEHDLRATLMEVDKSTDPYRLVQIARCTSDGEVKVGDHSMTIHQGVAGRCYRKRNRVIFNVGSGEFRQHMVDLGFPEEEAGQFKERGAYVCSPVIAGGEVIAVYAWMPELCRYQRDKA